MTRPSATARNRRHHLLSRTALAGLGIAVSIGTTPALAQVTGVGTVTSTASNGGAVGVASGGGVTDITLGASRSIVNWNNLGVASGDTLNFHFDNRGDIVLNRVTGSASIDGAVNGCVGTCGTTGGNVWILSSGGVMIGANARINTGGFLASTGGLTDADFLDGDMNFAFAGAPTDSTISVANGAQITAHGGTLALIAPIVNTAAGSTLTGANGGDVVYGSAENYNVTFAPTGADDLDLITFQVPSKADGSAGTPGLTLNGTTNANQVFAAVVSKNSVAASILLGGAITATAASGENGDIVLSASSGFTNGAADAPMESDGTITQDTTSTLAADNVTMRASGAIVVDEVNATGQVWLDSAWAGISQTGAITASSLRAEAGAGIDLTDAGNDFDTISFLDNDGSGVVSLTDVDGFAITGGVNNWMTAGTVSLTALNGSITQSGGGRHLGRKAERQRHGRHRAGQSLEPPHHARYPDGRRRRQLPRRHELQPGRRGHGRQPHAALGYRRHHPDRQSPQRRPAVRPGRDRDQSQSRRQPDRRNHPPVDHVRRYHPAQQRRPGARRERHQRRSGVVPDLQRRDHPE